MMCMSTILYCGKHLPFGGKVVNMDCSCVFPSPEREQTRRPAAPIDYQSLRASHLPQVHDLLTRVFWPGIDGEHDDSLPNNIRF